MKVMIALAIAFLVNQVALTIAITPLEACQAISSPAKVYVPSEGSCIFVNPTKDNFASAGQRCQSLASTRGLLGRLVWFQNQDSYDAFYTTMAPELPQFERYYIGGAKMVAGDVSDWPTNGWRDFAVDGSSVVTVCNTNPELVFRYSAGDPIGSAFFLQPFTRLIQDTGLATERPSICELKTSQNVFVPIFNCPQPTTTTTTSTTTTSISTTTSTVTPTTTTTPTPTTSTTSTVTTTTTVADPLDSYCSGRNGTGAAGDTASAYDPTQGICLVYKHVEGSWDDAMADCAADAAEAGLVGHLAHFDTQATKELFKTAILSRLEPSSFPHVHLGGVKTGWVEGGGAEALASIGWVSELDGAGDPLVSSCNANSDLAASLTDDPAGAKLWYDATSEDVRDAPGDVGGFATWHSLCQFRRPTTTAEAPAPVTDNCCPAPGACATTTTTTTSTTSSTATTAATTTGPSVKAVCDGLTEKLYLASAGSCVTFIGDNLTPANAEAECTALAAAEGLVGRLAWIPTKAIMDQILAFVSTLSTRWKTFHIGGEKHTDATEVEGLWNTTAWRARAADGSLVAALCTLDPSLPVIYIGGDPAGYPLSLRSTAEVIGDITPTHRVPSLCEFVSSDFLAPDEGVECPEPPTTTTTTSTTTTTEPSTSTTPTTTTSTTSSSTTPTATTTGPSVEAVCGGLTESLYLDSADSCVVIIDEALTGPAAEARCAELAAEQGLVSRLAWLNTKNVMDRVIAFVSSFRTIHQFTIYRIGGEKQTDATDVGGMWNTTAWLARAADGSRVSVVCTLDPDVEVRYRGPEYTGSDLLLRAADDELDEIPSNYPVPALCEMVPSNFVAPPGNVTCPAPPTTTTTTTTSTTTSTTSATTTSSTTSSTTTSTTSSTTSTTTSSTTTSTTTTSPTTSSTTLATTTSVAPTATTTSETSTTAPSSTTSSTTTSMTTTTSTVTGETSTAEMTSTASAAANTTSTTTSTSTTTQASTTTTKATPSTTAPPTTSSTRTTAGPSTPTTTTERASTTTAGPLATNVRDWCEARAAAGEQVTYVAEAEACLAPQEDMAGKTFDEAWDICQDVGKDAGLASTLVTLQNPAVVQALMDTYLPLLLAGDSLHLGAMNLVMAGLPASLQSMAVGWLTANAQGAPIASLCNANDALDIASSLPGGDISPYLRMAKDALISSSSWTDKAGVICQLSALLPPTSDAKEQCPEATTTTAGASSPAPLTKLPTTTKRTAEETAALLTSWAENLPAGEEPSTWIGNPKSMERMFSLFPEMLELPAPGSWTSNDQLSTADQLKIQKFFSRGNWTDPEQADVSNYWEAVYPWIPRTEEGNYLDKFFRVKDCSQCWDIGTESCGPHPEIPDRVNKCHCAKGFHGTQCEFQPNACHSQPCANGAKCWDAVQDGDFWCECAVGFRGPVCEERKDHFDPRDADQATFEYGTSAIGLFIAVWVALGLLAILLGCRDGISYPQREMYLMAEVGKLVWALCVVFGRRAAVWETTEDMRKVMAVLTTMAIGLWQLADGLAMLIGYIKNSGKMGLGSGTFYNIAWTGNYGLLREVGFKAVAIVIPMGVVLLALKTVGLDNLVTSYNAVLPMHSTVAGAFWASWTGLGFAAKWILASQTAEGGVTGRRKRNNQMAHRKQSHRDDYHTAMFSNTPRFVQMAVEAVLVVTLAVGIELQAVECFWFALGLCILWLPFHLAFVASISHGLRHNLMKIPLFQRFFHNHVKEMVLKDYNGVWDRGMMEPTSYSDFVAARVKGSGKRAPGVNKRRKGEEEAEPNDLIVPFDSWFAATNNSVNPGQAYEKWADVLHPFGCGLRSSALQRLVLVAWEPANHGLLNFNRLPAFDENKGKFEGDPPDGPLAPEMKLPAPACVDPGYPTYISPERLQAHLANKRAQPAWQGSQRQRGQPAPARRPDMRYDPRPTIDLDVHTRVFGWLLTRDQDDVNAETFEGFLRSGKVDPVFYLGKGHPAVSLYVDILGEREVEESAAWRPEKPLMAGQSEEERRMEDEEELDEKEARVDAVNLPISKMCGGLPRVMWLARPFLASQALAVSVFMAGWSPVLRSESLEKEQRAATRAERAAARTKARGEDAAAEKDKAAESETEELAADVCAELSAAAAPDQWEPHPFGPRINAAVADNQEHLDAICEVYGPAPNSWFTRMMYENVDPETGLEYAPELAGPSHRRSPSPAQGRRDNSDSEDSDSEPGVVLGERTSPPQGDYIRAYQAYERAKKLDDPRIEDPALEHALALGALPPQHWRRDADGDPSLRLRSWANKYGKDQIPKNK